ncbi:hypothetical protein DFQ27_008167 [Actinomortierella ambigua]|uniref:Uncharacterized protein n=1 Tax=Actinomortierella ambigua TaxID=1343610 RepID=A0A9P6PTB8_9FUNG|nr:hypothetical protein DFQ27_008167 [Actinomortierella ambigua]
MAQVQQDLVGKVAFITASAKNLGKQLAIALAKRGADIVIHHRRDGPQAEETAQTIRALGREVLILQGDLQSVATIEGLFQQTLDRFGHVDIVINNAGMMLRKNILDTTEEEFDAVFGTNTKASFFIMREAARHLADNGRVINIGTSLQAIMTGHFGCYAGSKAALDLFTRALAKEIGSRGITVNTVAPGPLNTTFFHAAETPQASAFMASLSPMNRLGEIDDIVPVIEFIASPASKWVSGQTIFVNGGVIAR